MLHGLCARGVSQNQAGEAHRALGGWLHYLRKAQCAVLLRVAGGGREGVGFLGCDECSPCAVGLREDSQRVCSEVRLPGVGGADSGDLRGHSQGGDFLYLGTGPLSDHLHERIGRRSQQVIQIHQILASRTKRTEDREVVAVGE